MQFFFKTKQGRFEKKASTDYKVHGDHMKTRNLLHKPAGREREKNTYTPCFQIMRCQPYSGRYQIISGLMRIQPGGKKFLGDGLEVQTRKDQSRPNGMLIRSIDCSQKVVTTTAADVRARRHGLSKCQAPAPPPARQVAILFRGAAAAAAAPVSVFGGWQLGEAAPGRRRSHFAGLSRRCR